MQQLSEERSVERDDLAETFADLVFSVEATKGNVFITLGIARIDHRPKTPIRSEIPVARIVLSHKATRELAEALGAAVGQLEKVTGDDHRAAIVVTRPSSH